jgi:hypothetical protein
MFNPVKFPTLKIRRIGGKKRPIQDCLNNLCWNFLLSINTNRPTVLNNIIEGLKRDWPEFFGMFKDRDF